MVGLSMVSILIFGMMGTMTWGFFSDNEHAANNLLTAGTLDLKLNDADGVTLILNAPQLKPNNSVGPATIALHNAGLAGASALDLVCGYTESDGAQNNTSNVSADDTAAVMEVTTLTYGGADLLGGIVDVNANTYVDIKDLSQANLAGQRGLAANESKDFIIAVKMRDGIDNNFQGDGVDITITFNLRQ